jgi:hypothetical protein
MKLKKIKKGLYEYRGYTIEKTYNFLGTSESFWNIKKDGHIIQDFNIIKDCKLRIDYIIDVEKEES